MAEVYIPPRPDVRLPYPPYEQIIISEGEAKNAIDRMAALFITRFGDAWPRPFFLIPLIGGTMYGEDIVRSIQRQDPDFHPETYYTLTTAYAGGRRLKNPRLVWGIKEQLENNGRRIIGRHGIILDDGLTSGESARINADHGYTLGAAAMELSVFAEKDRPSRTAYRHAEYRCHLVRDTWLTGRGFDDARYCDSNGNQVPDFNRRAEWLAVANSEEIYPPPDELY